MPDRRQVFADSLDTPLGRIRFVADERAVLQVILPGPGGTERPGSELACRHANARPGTGAAGVLERFREELEAYFQGTLRRFRSPVHPEGTAFQRRVWQTLVRIPFGQTRSYGWVAREAGFPGGARAVGQANARNPVPIVVPCHRVVNADGGIGGFSSGVDLKRWLIRWEQGEEQGLHLDR